ncbi:AraC family transcriptional regulator [Streptomyces sp. FH025]|uniref:helix-turn-helix domain-containing protein n=1 Tax=Streptomyces sp. FH025 TaxID=2815937 RepID=UPI001AA008FC|nr:helix-turn-helix transcriptional regulator [Streptomyces sp. FH025]MBO1420125.1 helix-turn-helix transcriptional regulator [Streptomyces sp. FH025]
MACTESELTVGRPGGGLRGRVVGYYGFRASRRGCHLVVPDGLIWMVFGFGAPIRIADAAGREPAVEAVSLVRPVQLTAVEVRLPPLAQGVVALVTPPTAHRLSGIPMTAWDGRELEPAGLLGVPSAVLGGRLARCGGWPERFRLLDDLFRRRLHGGPPGHSQVDRAWHALRRTGGRVPIEHLAADTGWSRRYLEQRFAEEVGRSPKAIAQVLRLRTAVRRMAAGLPLAEVAARAGFYDQSHFNRVFKAMMGCTPTGLPARRLGREGLGTGLRAGLG